MVDLKLTEQEAKDLNAPLSASSPGDGPKYPYGLCLYLSGPTLDKLGMSTLPAVGDEITLTGKAKVVSISQREQQDGDKDKSVDLQITALDLGKSVDDSEKAGRIYPGMS